MEYLVFDYPPEIGGVFLLLALLTIPALVKSVRDHRASRGHWGNAPVGLLVILTFAWIGVDHLTWKAEFGASGVSMSRKWLPDGINMPLAHPLRTIPWDQVEEVSFQRGVGGGKGRPASLSIMGTRGRIDLPVARLDKPAARQLAGLLARCSPGLSINPSVAAMNAAAETVTGGLLFSFGLRATPQGPVGSSCAQAGA